CRHGRRSCLRFAHGMGQLPRPAMVGRLETGCANPSLARADRGPAPTGIGPARETLPEALYFRPPNASACTRYPMSPGSRFVQFRSPIMIRPTLPGRRLSALYWLPLFLLLLGLWGDAQAIETTEQVLRPARPTNDILTPYERFWLREHPQLRLTANTHWPPFESVDESGRYQGMVMDYLELIQQRIGYQFQLVFRDTWSETLRALEEREVDAIPAISITPLREEQMLFSEQYISFPIVLAVRDDMPFIGGLDELDNERVGVVRGYTPQDFLLMSHPHLNLVLVDTLEEGLLK